MFNVKNQLDDSNLITVCDACLRASCWQGKFCCKNYRTAGTRQLTVEELRRLDKEHPCYWKRGQTAIIQEEMP